MLKLHLLGEFGILVDGQPVDVPLRAGQALLAYLALNAGTAVRREQLAGLLWPDMDEAAAKANLRHTLWRVRKALGPAGATLAADEAAIRLEPAAEFWLDTQVIGARAEPGASIEELLGTVAVYQGELLPGFYDDWVQLERERLQAAFESKMGQLLDALTAAARWGEVLEWGERWIALGQLPEAAYRALIMAHGARGDASQAAGVYRRCLDALQRELGVAPSAQTRAAYERAVKMPAGRVTEPIAERPLPALRGYELRERIGAGAFGEVYRAYQPSVERTVAIKVVAPAHADRPEFIRRFEAEARLVARLEHPHIVPLYDYWREPGGAYLVMRYLRGGSLREVLAAGRWTAARAADLVEQIGGALMAAHRQGVVHRDVKPENILLDEAGNAYLSDFGIAADLAGAPPEATSRSDRYTSPEQARGEPATAQSDLYSLGVVLRELLADTALPPAVAEMLERATHACPEQRYPSALAWMEAFRRAATSEAGPPTGLAPRREGAALVNPYKGLRAFEAVDEADFFGREALVERLLARLREAGPYARCLAVVGPSGSGKSSVVKAGLLPALRRGALAGSDRWFVVELTPGAHPLEELELALLGVAAARPARLMEQLRRDARGLVRAARLCLPEAGTQLLLVIDQFEEAFAPAVDPAESDHLLASLAAAATEPDSPVRVLITLRADFYDRPLLHAEFAEVIRARTEVVTPLTADEIAQAVRGPAERAGAEVEPDLGAALAADVVGQPGSLPLLQYALTEVFERREGRRLTLNGYHALGGASGALARRAEDAFAGLKESEQALARQVFLRLVTLGEGVEDTRRRALRSELEALGGGWLVDRGQPPVSSDPSPLTTILDSFGKARLLTFDRDPVTRTPTVELAHEALLREWPHLRGWLDESRADLRQQQALARLAGDWQAGGQDTSFLLAGTRLAQFEGWAAEAKIALTQMERAFLRASLDARDAQATAEADRQRRELEAAQKLAETEQGRAQEQANNAARLRRRAFYLAGAFGAALLLLVAALWFAQQASQNLGAAQAANTQAVAEVQSRSTAEANAVQARAHAEQQAALAFARELGAAAELKLAADPQLSLLLALQAISVTRAAGLGDPLDVQQTLHNVMPAQRLLWLQKVPYYPAKVAYSGDGKRFIVVADYANETYTIDTYSRETLRSVPGYGFALSPDETLIATSQWDNVVYLWDAVTSQLLVTMTGHTGAGIVGFAFSPDGNYLATGGHDDVARLWDLRAWRAAGRPAGVTLGQPARMLDCYSITGYYGGINFSPDGQRLVTVCDKDNTARVWDVASGKEVFSITGHTDWLSDADFSPDSQRLATSSVDGTARLWEAATGRELMRLNPGATTVQNVAFSPDGQYLATSSDQFAIVWDANTGNRLLDLPNPAPLVDLAFSPDGQRLIVTMNGWIQEWDISPLGRGELAIAPHGPLYDFNNSPDGTLFAGLEVDGRLHVYDSATLEEKWATQASTFPLPGDARTLSFSADNSLVAAGISNTVTIWRTDTGQKLTELRQPGEVWAGALSPDGRRLAASLAAGEIVLWDLAGRLISQTLPTGLGCLFSVEFSSDGAYLAAGGSSDGRPYCTGAQIDVWDLTASQERTPQPVVIRPNNVIFPNAVIATSFGPDGQRLAVAGNRGAAILDWATGTWALTMTAHTANVNYVKFSPDGKYVVTTSNDQTAKIWDAQTGTELLSYPLSNRSVWAFFTPQARGVVIVTSGVRTFRLNAFGLDELITAARARLVRDWEPEECQKYLHGPCP